MKNYLKNLIKLQSWFKSKLYFIAHIVYFLNSNFLHTLVVIVVAYFAWSIGIQQNEISKQLILLGNSPKYNQAIKFSIFETDLKIENISKVSLHNVQPEFVDIYFNPNTTQFFGGLETMLYDMDPGKESVVSIPSNFKTERKTIRVRICYVFNDNPFDRVDNSINPIKLKEDPFYESNRRFQAYDNSNCSSVFIKYNQEGSPEIM